MERDGEGHHREVEVIAMRLKLRYVAAILLIMVFACFLGWLLAGLKLTGIGLDLKYLESEKKALLARQANWRSIQSLFGRVAIVSSTVLGLLLIYRWFLVPSRA